MTHPAPLLAIAVAGIEFALEPGRVYRLGRGLGCDLRLRDEGLAEVAVVLQCVGDHVLVRGPDDAAPLTLRPGASARKNGVELRVVEDRGMATILPDPAMARAARLAAAAAHGARARAAAAETGATFADLMAQQLRQAPWLLVSLLVHAALLLVLLWLFAEDAATPPRGAVYALDLSALGTQDAATPHEAPPAVERETAPEPDFLADPLAPSDDAASPPPPPEPRERDLGLLRLGGQKLLAGSPRRSGGEGDVLARADVGMGGFRQRVAQLRRSGLEVVFVIDSTGSMGPTIRALQQGIAELLDTLLALVPEARIGMVTFRDQRDDYVTRSLPLGRDYFAAVNFAFAAQAAGGGDKPEAVLAGLRAAFAQDYAPDSCRVVVLAGDAPPHPRDLPPLFQAVQRFTAGGKATIHTLLTDQDPQSDAGAAFAEIASRGGGRRWTVAESHQLLGHVLQAAFGAEYEANLDAARRAVGARRENPPTKARFLARQGGPELLAALDVAAPPPELIDALAKAPRREVALQLIDALAGPRLRPATRQAMAHALQRMLALRQPPIDPMDPRPIAPALAAALRRAAEDLPTR